MNIRYKVLIYALVLYFLQFGIGKILDYKFISTSIYKSSIITSQADHLRKQDVIIFGGSNGLVSYDNEILEKNWNKEIYNLSEDDTNLKLHLLQLEMLISRQITPQFIILNIGGMSNKTSRNSLRYLPYLGSDKLVESYFKSSSPIQYWFFTFFPIAKWAKHNNDLLFPLIYSSLVNHNYHHRFDSNGDYEYPKGNSLITDSIPPQKTRNLNSNNPFILKFKKICSEHRIQLLIVNTPYYNTEVIWKPHNKDLINFSTFDNKKSSSFYDEMHLNKSGKNNYTKYFLDSMLKKGIFSKP